MQDGTCVSGVFEALRVEHNSTNRLEEKLFELVGPTANKSFMMALPNVNCYRTPVETHHSKTILQECHVHVCSYFQFLAVASWTDEWFEMFSNRWLSINLCHKA